MNTADMLRKSIIPCLEPRLEGYYFDSLYALRKRFIDMDVIKALIKNEARLHIISNGVLIIGSIYYTTREDDEHQTSQETSDVYLGMLLDASHLPGKRTSKTYLIIFDNKLPDSELGDDMLCMERLPMHPDGLRRIYGETLVDCFVKPDLDRIVKGYFRRESLFS